MKKIIASLIVLIMLSGLFAGCGSKNKPNENTPTDPPKTTDPEKPSEKPEPETPGTELSTFMNGYTESKTKVWEAMSKKFEEQENVAFMMGSMGFAFADLALLDIILFDALTVKDGDSFKGKLMFSNIDAWKKVKGDITEFGYDFTYKEDKNNYKPNDHEIAKGKFDKKSNSLSYERTTERSGKTINRLTVEIVKNSEGSYSSQVLFAGSLDDENESSSGLNGYFTWFEGQDMISVLAQDESANSDFNYTTIIGKKNVKPEEMTGSMKIVIKSSFIKGVATYEAIEDN